MGGHRVFRRTACAVAVAAIFTPSSALPAAVNWTDGTGFWDAAANWSSNPLLPGAGDDVTVNVAGLNTITYRTGTTTVDSLTFSGTNTLAVTAGTLAVANAYSNSSLTNISGGTLTLNGASTADSLTLSSGVFRGTGTVSISGATTWSGGTMTGAGTTQANGGIAISGDTAHDLTGGRVLNVAGNSTWSGNTFASGGSIRTGAGAQINNAGVWQDQNAFDSSISNAFGGAASSFNNTGTYTKSGAGTTDIGIAFNNTSGGAGTGVVNVTAGTLQLSGGGTSNGTFTIAGGAALDFAGGTSHLNGASLAASAGRLLVSAGTLNTSGTITHGGLTELTFGTLSNGGTLNTATYLQSGGTLSGSGPVNVSGLVTWSGGTMTGAGTTQANGGIAISGDTAHDLTGGRVLNVAGNSTWSGNTFASGGSIRTGAGAQINNAGVWQDQNAFDSSISNAFGGAASSFNNTGTYTKSGAGTTDIGIAFNNTSGGAGTGVVNVTAGTLQLSGGGTSNGTFTIAGGATLDFAGGTSHLNGASLAASAGRLLVSAGTLNTSGTITHGGLTELTFGTLSNGGTLNTATYLQSGGTLSGSGPVNVSGLVTWSGGTMTGAGTTQANGGIAISGDTAHDLTGGRVLNVAGNSTWSGNTFASGGSIRTGAGAQINNAGVWQDQNAFDSSISNAFGGAASSFNNTGTYTKSGAGTTDIGIAFNNTSGGAGTGVVNVTAGTLQLSGGGTSNGTFTIAGGATLDFAGGTSHLNGASLAASAGRLLVSAGTLNTSGTITHGGLTELTFGTLSNGGTLNTATYLQSGGTLSGSGPVNVSGLLTWSGGTMTGAGTTQANGGIAISGDTAHDLTGGRVLNVAGNSTWSGNTFASGGSIRTGAGAQINNTGVWQDQNAFDSSIVNAFGGAASSLNNTGTYTKSGAGTTDIGIAATNSGIVNANAGVLNLSNGIQGATGAVNIGTGGTVVLGAASTVGTLNHSGSAATGLSLDANNVTVSADYNNANFGTGNAFNRYANVSRTTGAILAGGDANQAITAGFGTSVGGGTTATPTLTIGNVHVGETTYTYHVANTGTSGPSIRGAVQTSGGGANISDGRLSGSGVSQGSFGPIGLAGSESRDVTITIGAAGVYAPIAGQAVGIVNNFENLNQQLLTIESAAGAAAYNLAAAAAVTPNPVTLTNQRVGGTNNVALTIANIAPAGSFSEAMNASFGALSGAALTNGGAISLLAAGNANGSAMAVRLDGSTAGAKSGSVQIDFVSDGTGTSGLGLTQLASQIVTVNGAFYNTAQGAASPNPIDLGNFRVGQAGGAAPQSQNVELTNTVAGPFTESLGVGSANVNNAAFTLTNNLGNGLITAGASHATALNVARAGGVAGLNTGTLSIQYTSDGTGTSGLAAIDANSQNLTVNATGYNAAVGAATPTPIVFANMRVGAPHEQALVVANTAAAGSFSEDLGATFGASVGDARTNAGSVVSLAAGSTNSGSMRVNLDNATAGAKSGSVTLNYETLGTVGGVSNGLGAAGVGSQTISVSGNVYQVAQPNPSALPAQVNLGNFRAGSGPASQVINIQNASAGAPVGFQEGLNAVIGTLTGAATGTGFNNAAVGTSGALQVGLSGIAAGVNSGTVQVQLQSSGITETGSNGLGTLDLGVAQNVTVSGTGWRLAQANAQPVTVNFGNVLINSAQAQFLNIQNTALNDGFSEMLDASFKAGGTTGDATHNGGSVSLLAAGGTVANAMAVGVNTSTIGAKVGQVIVAFNSNGQGTSGLGITDLPEQNIGVLANVEANVGTLAQPSQATPNPVNFGNFRVGAAAPGAVNLTIANLATVGEGLNASIATGSAGFGASGSFTSLAPQQTNNSALQVSFSDTATAGARSGAATITLVSDGTFNGGVTTPLPAQVVHMNANVFRLATGAATGVPVDLGTFRVGGALPSAQTVSVTNTAAADGFSEQLGIQSVAAGNSLFTASNLLGAARINAGASAPGAIGIGAGAGLTAGVNNGSVTVHFLSDGTASGTGAAIASNSQIFDATATGYRVANPLLNTPSVTLAARVGEVSPVASVSVTNSSPDQFTEGLQAAIATASAGFTASGTIAHLGAQGTDAATLRVGLSTGTAGSFSGSAALTLASTGAGTTGAPDLALAGQNVNLSGKVYTQAVAQVASTHVNFGIVHVGDVVTAQAVGVTNAAPVSALNDVLVGALGGGAGPFTAGGTLGAGLAAGQTDSASLTVGLNTAAAGVFEGTATASFASHDPDLTDLALADVGITLAAQVNNYARPIFGKAAGDGGLDGSGLSFVLDFGNVVQGSGPQSATLFVENDVTGPADLLAGDFDFDFGALQDFDVSGFTAFTGLDAGQMFGGLLVNFDPLALGSFDDLVFLNATGYNAGGFSADLPRIGLQIRGTVVATGQVPEPGSLVLLMAALAALPFGRRPRRRKELV
jgi:hypothetical protein